MIYGYAVWYTVLAHGMIYCSCVAIWYNIRSLVREEYIIRASGYHTEGISPVPARNGYHWKKGLWRKGEARITGSSQPPIIGKEQLKNEKRAYNPQPPQKAKCGKLRQQSGGGSVYWSICKGCAQQKPNKAPAWRNPSLFGQSACTIGHISVCQMYPQLE